LAEKLQNNDTTPCFIAALIFDAEEGAAPRPKAATADSVEIERADVASDRATQWTERAPKAASANSREPSPDLETAVRSGNVQDRTASFLVDPFSKG
jgi:hypothetical protein